MDWFSPLYDQEALVTEPPDTDRLMPVVAKVPNYPSEEELWELIRQAPKSGDWS